ncbi:MAG TPA: flagellar basal-body rod protein FlgF, partial [Egibacteraceae bacterium]|nr:flagellar basal-body rod protein FlgF [Egibacteraceae bacterium]
MLRSMYAGVSGLRSHQTMMDVIGNNIANVNTTGFKASSVTFQDTLSQMIGGAGAPNNQTGGTNPAQVGLGVRVSSITTNFSQGASQLTGRTTDLAIQGDGMFMVRSGGENMFTRQGAFSFDAAGRLVTAQGAVVQGWIAGPNGGINTNAPVRDLVLPVGQLLQPQQTRTATLGGNLPANAAEGTVITSSVNVYDLQGTEFSVSVRFTKSGDDTWDIEATTPDPTDPDNPHVLYSGTIGFDPSTGQVDFGDGIQFGFPVGSWNGDVSLDLQTNAAGGLRQFSGANTVAFERQDGSAVGFLRSFSISPAGVLTGVFSNGQTRAVGQLALANFNNPQGLEKVGDSLYRASVNSGLPQVGVAGAGGRGSLAGGMLEMSNVDLAQEFTNLIVAQRGFQANSRIIT